MGHASTFLLLAFVGICAFDPEGAHQVADTVGYGAKNALQKVRLALDEHVSAEPIPEPEWVRKDTPIMKIGGNAAEGGTAVPGMAIDPARAPLPPLEKPLGFQPTDDDWDQLKPSADVRRNLMSVSESCLIQQYDSLYALGLRGNDIGRQAVATCNLRNHDVLRYMPAGDVRAVMVYVLSAARLSHPDIGF